MSAYRTDRVWSDRFIPSIKNIVGPRLLEPSSIEQDCREATDLLVLKARDMRIAARMRRPGYATAYPFDFTLRSFRQSGAKTEFRKIYWEGWGDWFFYGHAPYDGEDIARWWIIDLQEWRLQTWHSQYRAGKPDPRDNGDGTYFVAFDLRKFNPSILVAGSDPVPFEGWPS